MANKQWFINSPLYKKLVQIHLVPETSLTVTRNTRSWFLTEELTKPHVLGICALCRLICVTFPMILSQARRQPTALTLSYVIIHQPGFYQTEFEFCCLIPQRLVQIFLLCLVLSFKENTDLKNNKAFAPDRFGCIWLVGSKTEERLTKHGIPRTSMVSLISRHA